MLFKKYNDSKRINILINIFDRKFNKIDKKRRNYVISIWREYDFKLDILIFKTLKKIFTIFKINLIYFNYNKNNYITREYKKELIRIDRRAKKIARINEL